ncbi:uncharacterized protein J3R85_019133 [Psidium guajava]|nr:uncharacterized protein J3R85_019133 [Psidium guajava]
MSYGRRRTCGRKTIEYEQEFATRACACPCGTGRRMVHAICKSPRAATFHRGKTDPATVTSSELTHARPGGPRPHRQTPQNKKPSLLLRLLCRHTNRQSIPNLRDRFFFCHVEITNLDNLEISLVGNSEPCTNFCWHCSVPGWFNISKKL